MGGYVIKYFVLVLLCILVGIKSTAQIITADDDFDEKRFMLNVKDIGEFIDRFNDAPNSSFRVEVKKMYPSLNITRKQVLTILFGKRNKSWNNADTAKFVSEICNPTKPQYLDFKAGNWYAKVLCVFRYKNRRQIIPLILKTSYNPATNSVVWIISGLVWNESFKDTLDLKPLPATSVSNRFIPASNYATNFTGLAVIFENSRELPANLSGDLVKSKAAAYFMKHLQAGSLKFIAIQSVRYYFFQVANWFFTVDDEGDSDMHSGWLISALKRINGKDKSTYTQKILAQ